MCKMVTRRGLIIGAGVVALFAPAVARAQFNGCGEALCSVGAGTSPFVPLPGSAIDLNFATGQYFGGTPSDCFNAGKTLAAGALLSALIGTSASIVLFLKPIVPAPDGSSLWFVDNLNSRFIFGLSNAIVRIATTSAVLGGSTTFGSNSKVGSAWGVGRSVVGNGGTVATNGATFTAGAVSVSVNLNIDALCDRLTVWTSKLSDATLQGLTI